MDLVELRTYAEQENIIKFLSEKTKNKINQITEYNGKELDEIETYLAYLQIGKDLGLDVSLEEMRHQKHSNVTREDLDEAKKEFLSSDSGHRIAKHIYEDEALRNHPSIKKIIADVNDRAEFSTELQDNENTQNYILRLDNLTKVIAAATILEINEAIESQEKRRLNNSVKEALKQSLVDFHDESDLLPSVTPNTKTNARMSTQNNSLTSGG